VYKLIFCAHQFFPRADAFLGMFMQISSKLARKHNKSGLRNNSRLAVEDQSLLFSKVACANTDSVISHFLFEIFLGVSTVFLCTSG
jgi:hypothetical protein